MVYGGLVATLRLTLLGLQGHGDNHLTPFSVKMANLTIVNIVSPRFVTSNQIVDIWVMLQWLFPTFFLMCKYIILNIL